MCPRLSERWCSDSNRKPRKHIVGPIAYHVAIAMFVVAVAFFCALFLIIVFRWGGADAWPIVGVMAASVVLVFAVLVAVDRLMRRSRRP
jgi:uncharacterized membrane protein